MKLSGFDIGLVSMAFFTFVSNILNYISIGSNVWTTDTSTSLWRSCIYPIQINLLNPVNRYNCFGSAPPGLIATGTALNAIALVLIVIALGAFISNRFKDTYAIYFVIASFAASFISLLLNSIGWYLIVSTQYQQVASGMPGVNAAFQYGWSFWLMTPTFACSFLACLVASAMLGCICQQCIYSQSQDNRSIYSASRQDPNLSFTTKQYVTSFDRNIYTASMASMARI